MKITNYKHYTKLIKQNQIQRHSTNYKLVDKWNRNLLKHNVSI